MNGELPTYHHQQKGEQKLSIKLQTFEFDVSPSERINNQGIMAHFVNNKLLNNSQHGFPANCSCPSNLLMYLEQVTMNVKIKSTS